MIETSFIARRLSLLQLSDSAFPNGRYTLSYGLEAYAQSGLLPTRNRSPALTTLLGDCIRFAVGPSDGVAIACAHRATDRAGTVDLGLVACADERLTAVKLAREAREASTRTGRALLGSAMDVFGATGLSAYSERVKAGRSPGNHAVVFGLLSAQLSIQRLDAVVVELFAFSASWVAAAVRLALIDHRAAQRLLQQVRGITAAAARYAVNRDVTQISSCTPLLDVLSMRHETAEVRVFAN